MQSKLQISRPTLFLCGYIFVAQFILGLNTAKAGISDAFGYWYIFTSYFALSWWFINDARNHDIKWFDKYMDMGMLLYVAGIFLFPYYLIKTRGWKKALIMIAILLSIFVGATILGGILALLTSIF